MNCHSTLKGVKLCIENSLRLFKNASSPDVSLPKTAALVEIALEETVKETGLRNWLFISDSIKLRMKFEGYLES